MTRRQTKELIDWLAILLAMLLILATPRRGSGQTTSVDIGSPTPAGITAADYDVAGSGANVWDKSDQFRFVYQPVSGNFIAVARVESVSSPAGVEPLVGIMARASLDPNAANVYARSTGSNGTSFKLGVRPTAGAVTTSVGNVGSNAPGYLLRLTRNGAAFAGEYSLDAGATWRSIGSVTATLPESCLIGLAVCSRTNGKLSTARFTGFAVSVPGPTTGPATSPTPPATLPTKQPATTNERTIGAGYDLDAAPPIAAGTKAKLAAGTFTIDKTIVFANTNNVFWLGAKNPDGSPATWIKRGSDFSGSSVTLNDDATVIRFENVGFSGDGGAKVTLRGSDLTFVNCPPKDSGDGFMNRGAEWTCVADTHAGVLNSYFYFSDCERDVVGYDASGNAIRKITAASIERNRARKNFILRCSADGAVNSACVRLYAWDDGEMKDNVWRNGDWKCFQYRDGRNSRFENEQYHGSIPITLGPRADPEENDCFVRSPTFVNCAGFGQWELEAGLISLVLQNCSNESAKTSCFTVRPNFAGKGVASGTFTSSKFKWTGGGSDVGRFFVNDWTGGIAVRSRGNTFDGKALN